MESTIKIPCLEVKQPIGTFYVGVIPWNELLEITRKDIERIRSEEKDGTYFGIQRGLSSKRLKEISQYVTFEDATFPSSVVLSIDSIYYNNDKDEVEQNIIKYDGQYLEINNNEKVAKIIDGQHRVFGLEKYILDNPLLQDELTFNFIVTIFIDIDEEYESNIFATINKAQTRVNNSLVYDLYDLAKTKSPQRTAHNVVKLLNEDVDSPLYRQIKRLGYSETGLETVAQATIVQNLLKYISSNPSLDRDILIKGKKLKLIEDSKNLERLFFRNWFIKGEDEKIARIIWNYFTATKNKWPNAWVDTSKIISKSTGIIALLRFLKNIVNHYGVEKIITIDEFAEVMNKIDITEDDLVNKNYKSGGVGQSDLYKDFCKSTNL